MTQTLMPSVRQQVNCLAEANEALQRQLRETSEHLQNVKLQRDSLQQQLEKAEADTHALKCAMRWIVGYLANGSSIGEQSSVDFHCNVHLEVKAVLERLRGQLQHETDALQIASETVWRVTKERDELRADNERLKSMRTWCNLSDENNKFLDELRAKLEVETHRADSAKRGLADWSNELSIVQAKLEKTEAERDKLKDPASFFGQWEAEKQRADRAEARVKELEAERDEQQQHREHRWWPAAPIEHRLECMKRSRDVASARADVAESRLAAAMTLIDFARAVNVRGTSDDFCALEDAFEAFDASERERASGAKDPSSGAVEGS